MNERYQDPAVPIGTAEIGAHCCREHTTRLGLKPRYPKNISPFRNIGRTGSDTSISDLAKH